MGYFLILLGIATTGLVLFQLGQISMQTFAGARFGRLNRRLALDELRAKIELLKEMHREVEIANEHGWNGFRKFLVKQIRRETKMVSSIYLAPHDGKKLPPFKPGQFLTFNLRIPGQEKAVVRCYSLSSSSNENHYRVTVKKVLANPKDPNSRPGLSSTYFNEALKEGDILDVKTPGGSFFLDLHNEKHPVVLIGGGIGVTPVLSMFQALADRKDNRETWFFYGVRNKEELVLAQEIQEVADSLENVHVRFCLSDEKPTEQDGADFLNERVSVDLFKKTLPSNNYQFLICGPPPMMEAITNGLKEWGVPDNRIFFEAFGFATVKKAATAADASAAKQASFKVKYARSNKICDWDAKATSLLDLAESNSISIASGCRTGNCGTCLVAVKSGEVSYLHEPGFKPEAGTCLTCIAVPKGEIEIDA